MPEQKKNIKVAVLAGGISNERDISLQSGKTIADALVQAGLEVISSDIAPDKLDILDDRSIDVFFLALHGKFGEDGELQEILEQRDLCFAGSGSAASKIAINKIACKEAVQITGIALPLHISVQDAGNTRHLIELIRQLGTKVVVKPISDGSSFGVRIIDDAKAAAEAGIETSKKFGDCMIEQYIRGREITIGILNGKPLPIIEIKSKHNFYDFDAKYLDDNTEYLFDTIKDKKLIENINALAVQCFNAVGCSHWSRVDMILSEDNVPYFLEINTLPGFTSHSLVPMAANKAGLTNAQLCLEIVNAAIETFKKGDYIGTKKKEKI